MFPTILQLYVYSAGTYSVCSAYDFGTPTADIKHVVIYNDVLGNAHMVVAIKSGTDLKIYRFDISGTDSISLVLQTTVITSVPPLVYLSEQGNYLLTGTANPHTISIYRFNITTVPHSYTLSYFKSSLPYSPFPDYPTNFIKDDASYFYYRSSQVSTNINSWHLYF